MTRKQYDTVRDGLTEAGDWPPPNGGCELHVCFGEEGDIRVSEVWETREKFDEFGETLGPRIEQAGIRMSGEPESFDVHIVDRF